MMGQKRIKMYTLSTCSHCRAAKKFMNDCGAEYEFTDVDLLTGAARLTAIEEVKRLNPSLSFPTIMIGDDIVIGFQEGEIRKALGLE